ncbi:hypothetical protein ACYOEI_41930, partial [Singulisphaera rosea]
PSTGGHATPNSLHLGPLDPATATNVANYSLFNTTTQTDESSFLLSATFADTTNYDLLAQNNLPIDSYLGQILLTFASGLPAGTYTLTAHTKDATHTGILDAAGNALNNTNATQSPDFKITFSVQTQAVYITGMQALSGTTANSAVVGGPRSYYEINPTSAESAYINAPPKSFLLSFSNPLNPASINNNSVQVIASRDSANGTADGDFGTLGVAGLGSTGTGFTVLQGVTVKLINPNQLLVTLASDLAADNYRLYLPNA